MNFNDVFQFCPKCGSKHFGQNNEKSKKCDNCGFVYYLNPSSATAAFIFNEKGELLVNRRSKEPAKGTLDLPGGFVDYNETGEEGIAREVKEETGLEITGSKYLFSAAISSRCQTNTHIPVLTFPLSTCSMSVRLQKAHNPLPPTMPPNVSGFRNPKYIPSSSD